MPKIAVYDYLTFFVVMFDILNEPPHLHVYSSKSHSQNSAKIWIKSGDFATLGKLSGKDQTLVKKLVDQNREELLDVWNDILMGKKRKPIKFKLK
ncbi:DUF4160 domain-containing protein [Persicitalea sp.]|uniref:DUF4160 domain-containing protein n=1 Tax=Persicitalea sp. TaxID=3100273 RepID=UPI0035934E6C